MPDSALVLKKNRTQVNRNYYFGLTFSLSTFYGHQLVSGLQISATLSILRTEDSSHSYFANTKLFFFMSKVQISYFLKQFPPRANQALQRKTSRLATNFELFVKKEQLTKTIGFLK